MSIRRILAVAIRIARQFIRDRRTLVLMLAAPLLVMLVLNSVLTGRGPEVVLGVVTPDATLMSSLGENLTDRFKEVKGVNVVTVERGSVDTALRQGEAAGVLIFPASGNPREEIILRLEGSDPLATQRLRLVVQQAVDSLARDAPGGASAPAAPSRPIRTTYLYASEKYTETDALAPYFIGLFAFLFVFLLTSVAFLRERSQGTIERIVVSPLSRSELVVGYLLGFALFALLQSTIILVFVVLVLRIHFAGSLGLLFLVTMALTVGAVNLGIFTSAFARNELQVIQFVPLLLVPQILLGGLFFPIKTLPAVVKQMAYIFPMTYANLALKDVMMRGFGFSRIWPELLFLAVFASAMAAAAVFSLRREAA
jgi:ABC-2 type transport system permease protein